MAGFGAALLFWEMGQKDSLHVAVECALDSQPQAEAPEWREGQKDQRPEVWGADKKRGCRGCEVVE